MLGSINKTAAEARDCFDLMAADISDLWCSVSYEFLVSGIWYLVSGSSFELKSVSLHLVGFSPLSELVSMRI